MEKVFQHNKATLEINVKSVDDIDRLIGEKISGLRILVGMTRKDLANHIGVTHQQLHKYEKAINRIPVSRLVAIAKALSVDIGYFFTDATVGGDVDKPDTHKTHADLIKDFTKIKDEKQKSAIKSLIKALTGI